MDAVAYFITFTTYGTWLHGDARGSADRSHNAHGTPYRPADAGLWNKRRQDLAAPPYQMDALRRQLVLSAIREHAGHRGWALHAAHVRTTHVHLVVTATQTPERVMDECKAYASRALNGAEVDPADVRRWTRHGSTRYLTSEESLRRAVAYTLDEQGDRMDVHDGSQPQDANVRSRDR